MRFSLRNLYITLLLGCASCASPGAELNVAPLFARHTAPNYQHAEALGGIMQYHREGDAERWSLQPAFYKQNHDNGAVEAVFAGGLGYYDYEPETEHTYSHLLPLYSYNSEIRPDGIRDTDWSALLWLLGGGSSSDDEENYFWVFPFYGTGKDFLTYDEFKFIMFPFYLESKQKDRRAYHYLWPFFGYTEGSETGWHAWPFYGEANVKDRYNRFYAMWPFYTQSTDDLDKKYPRKAWMLFPFIGHTQQDDYNAYTIVPPIFGWANRPSTGYSSWQLWPLLKFENGGKREKHELQRILPFWTHFKNEQTEYSIFMWPFFWSRKDDYGRTKRESTQLVPLFLWANTYHPDGTVTTDVRIWPFAGYTKRSGPDDSDLEHKVRVLDLGMPGLFDSETMSKSFGAFYQLWLDRKAVVDDKPIHEKRAFLNMYHSVESAGHSRWSIPVLGGQWTEPNGITHSSWLFGLIRWRSGDDGGFEAPAFPGPGWPNLSQ